MEIHLRFDLSARRSPTRMIAATGPLVPPSSIAPGMIWTQKQIDRANADDPAKVERYLDRQCIKELLEPADVARLALWLASDEARRCSGQTFILDGGVV